MKKPRTPPLRDSWQEAWELAHDLTVDKLQQADLRERCEKGGCARRAHGGEIELVFLGRTYRVRPPEFSVVPADGADEIPLTERILILHYLGCLARVFGENDYLNIRKIRDGIQRRFQ